MSEAMIAVALLASATGLVLAHMRSGQLALPIALFAGAALVGANAMMPRALADIAPAAAGVCTIVTALALYWPGRVPQPVAAMLAINGGLWCGALAHSLDPVLVPISLAPVMVAVPGRSMVQSSTEWRATMLRTVAGWTMAIAILTTALPYLVTPGSQSDHSN